jgi:polysaccharide export outer membrane protein
MALAITIQLNVLPMSLTIRTRSILARLSLALLAWNAALLPAPSWAAEYLIGSGDVLRISVFQNADLTLETRVGEDGTITYPLIGSVRIGGSTIPAAERHIAQLLKEGGFVLKPQVSILLMTVRGSQVSVLGQVNRPGRYPIETANMRIADALATAGGIATTGADTVVFVGTRDGKPMRQVIDLENVFGNLDAGRDFLMRGGDILYVERAPVFYIYGEVQRPGSYRVERDMTVMQALAAGGGLTPKGTQKGLRIHRRGGNGKIQTLELGLDDPVQANDVLYVKESLF